MNCGHGVRPVSLPCGIVKLQILDIGLGLYPWQLHTEVSISEGGARSLPQEMKVLCQL